ncbi:hypothetical protein [uncultured Anaerococcus sp.]|uniref:hypothetical protein n=1 Tax=uncultured Anaerococcus sp. TaxID=293428 RepID=UPI0025E485EA|nr:hypothetical protein [uncultured Anaerococcus sp.]
MKKINLFVVPLAILLTISPTAFAQESKNSDNPSTMGIDDHRIYNTKSNVRRYEQWGSGVRVSDNIRGIKGDTISVTYSRTFSPEVSGNIRGINVKLGASFSSTIGKTFHLPQNGTYYIAYRVRYSVEEGINTSKTSSGAVLGRHSYKVKNPIHKEYYLKKVN